MRILDSRWFLFMDTTMVAIFSISWDRIPVDMAPFSGTPGPRSTPGPGGSSRGNDARGGRR